MTFMEIFRIALPAIAIVICIVEIIFAEKITESTKKKLIAKGKPEETVAGVRRMGGLLGFIFALALLMATLENIFWAY